MDALGYYESSQLPSDRLAVRKPMQRETDQAGLGLKLAVSDLRHRQRERRPSSPCYTSAPNAIGGTLKPEPPS